MLISRNPWESTDRADLVLIGRHRLWISTSGPRRLPGSPVLLFFTGGGVPVAAHVRLQALLSKKIRVYFYDRAGYDLSEDGPNTRPTAEDSALELVELLKSINVGPPYILAAHSLGGLIAREFFSVLPDSDVVAMVLVDTATELMFQVFPGIPDPNLEAVADGIDFATLTHLQEESKLTQEEWERAVRGIERTAASLTTENVRGGAWELAKKKQFEHLAFGNRPLGIIRCNTARLSWQRMYDLGIKEGNGTEKQRRKARDFIAKFSLFQDQICAAQLRLSTTNLYQYVPDCGHDIPLRKPEIIVEAVEWAIKQCDTAKTASAD